LGNAPNYLVGCVIQKRNVPGAPSLVVVVVLLPPPMPAESGATDLFWSSGAGDGTWPFGAGEGTFELKELEELKLGLCQLYV